MVSGALLLSPYGPTLGLIEAGGVDSLAGIGTLGLLVGLGGLCTSGIVLTNLVLLARFRHSFGLSYFNLTIRGATAGRLLLAACAVWLLPALLVGFVYRAFFLEPALHFWLLGALYAFNWSSWLLPGRRTLGDYLAGGEVVPRADVDDRLATLRSMHLADVALVVLPVLPGVLALPWLTADEGLGAVVGGVAGSLLIAGLQWGLFRASRQSWAGRAFAPNG